MTHARAGAILVRYEAALWSVLGSMAYLARDNANLVYPDILWLFAALLAVSLGSAWAVRRRPLRDWPHAVCTVLSFTVIAAIQSNSGGAQSNLWVLYLLPLFTSALLLRGRELAWLAGGASLCDAFLYMGPDSAWGASVGFELAVKTGVLWAAAGSTWALAEGERRARARAESQRAELGRLESDLRAAEIVRDQDQRLAVLGLASAAAAHDMSTPLMVIRGFARVRLDQPDLDLDLKRDLEHIDRAAVFCQKLASSTLVEARGGDPGGPRLSLLKALENALVLSEEVLRANRIALRRDYEDGEFRVRGQGQDLERLFLNLIGNAVKAMPNGGTLTVRLSASAPPESRRAEVSVEDSGPGVPPEVLPKLFSPFVTSRAGSGGTGLGLYMCRETARRHGGELSAFNRPGGGATFVVRLPLERTAPLEAPNAGDGAKNDRVVSLA